MRKKVIVSKRISLLDRKFIRLSPIQFVGQSDNGHANWMCKCDCGKLCIKSSSDLLTGNTKSCGCLKEEINKIKSITHGMRYTRFHKIWTNMKSRCLNPNVPDYKYYGARGIKVSTRWCVFTGFYEDMYEQYIEHICCFGIKNTTLERKDNDGNYESINCTWATRKEQRQNRSDR